MFDLVDVDTSGYYISESGEITLRLERKKRRIMFTDRISKSCCYLMNVPIKIDSSGQEPLIDPLSTGIEFLLILSLSSTHTHTHENKVRRSQVQTMNEFIQVRTRVTRLVVTSIFLLLLSLIALALGKGWGKGKSK